MVMYRVAHQLGKMHLTSEAQGKAMLEKIYGHNFLKCGCPSPRSDHIWKRHDPRMARDWDLLEVFIL